MLIINGQKNATLAKPLEHILYVLTLFALMDFARHFDRISMGIPILYLKGSQVEISKI